MTWIVWLIISVTLMVFEMIIQSFFFFFCFSIGSTFAALISYFNISDLIEFTVFAVTSIVSIYFIRPVLKKILCKSKMINSNVDALIGEDAMVLERVTPLKSGFVKVLGEVWRAKSNIEVEVGERVRIEGVSGTTLIVKKCVTN
ncbi:MAG: NfeD family protein [Endomicrobium sp.]|jgi:membrane protein implicated in regulation of membrane protease activity|nr:NfeD family protein [Endomicrobium sp.]